MAGTLKDVMTRVRSMIGDPDGDFAASGYLLPLIAQVYDQQINQLEITGSPILIRVVVLLSVPAGTRDLGMYQAEQMPVQDGVQVPGPLCGLLNPLEIDWKQAGQPDTYYREAYRRQTLPDVANPVTGAGNWPGVGMVAEWRASKIYLTPVSFDTDIRVRAEIAPGTLLQDTDLVAVPRMVSALAYGTAALVGAERGNQGYVETYGDQAKGALDDVANQLVRAEQSVPCRVGRSGRGRR